MVSEKYRWRFQDYFFDFKVDTKKFDSVLCIGKVSHYNAVVSISVIDFIYKQRNDDDTMIFSIKLFGSDDNGVKLFKQLTTKVPHDCNSNFFNLYLYEVVITNINILFFLFKSREGWFGKWYFWNKHGIQRVNFNIDFWFL